MSPIAAGDTLRCNERFADRDRRGADSEESLRERLDEVCVPGTRGRKCKLHIPDEDGEPLCVDQRGETRWHVKSIGVYPPGFREFCADCRQLLDGDSA